MLDLDLLADAVAELPALIADLAGWRSLRIDYHPPFVDRAWRPWRDGRLFVHRLHPCAPGDALFHPHPWPSAIALLAGRYEMALGYGPGIAAPPIAAEVVLGAGDAYVMAERDGWHRVRPVDGPVLSVMIAGPPWAREMPVEPAVPQRSLEPVALAALLDEVRATLGRP